MKQLYEASGVIFDCDGTLLDTLGAWEEAERDLFAQAGPLTQAQEDAIHAAPIELAAQMFHDLYGVGQSAESILQHLDDELLSYYQNEACPFPGACELVRNLYERSIPCVIVSSSPRRYLDAGLKHAGIRDCFIELITTDEVGASKQDPEIYERALTVLGTTKEETWAVDDAPYAVSSMTDFGLQTVGVGSDPSAERRAQLKECATVYVDTLEELL